MYVGGHMLMWLLLWRNNHDDLTHFCSLDFINVLNDVLCNCFVISSSFLWYVSSNILLNRLYVAAFSDLWHDTGRVALNELQSSDGADCDTADNLHHILLSPLGQKGHDQPTSAPPNARS